MGPYDRRTIIGMRIKKTLTSEHVLEDEAGNQLTVANLLGRRPKSEFNADRSGSFSLVQATYPASLVEVQNGPFQIPKFKGEVEARVQGDVLRMAGRFRQGLGWREDRVKIPLAQVAHARIVGSRVDLWLRPADGKTTDLSRMQHLALDLLTPDAAGELAEWLPAATPPPPTTPMPLLDAPGAAPASHFMLWIGVVGAILAVGFLLLLLVFRRAI